VRVQKRIYESVIWDIAGISCAFNRTYKQLYRAENAAWAPSIMVGKVSSG
jgi:hypothetical protein